jgi:hypothetical protein
MVDHRKGARHDRLKEALRENLKRRKAQAKGQAKRRAERLGNDRDQRNSVEPNESDSGNEA